MNNINDTFVQDLKLINRYTRRELTSEEVYIFNVILCDNEVDRDFEAFSLNSLNKLSELFLGKTGIFDHNPKGNNQTARIFDTQVITDSSKSTKYGQPYSYIKAKAYMIKSDKNKDLILDIDAGIKKEVSVGCSVKDKICSICGVNLKNNFCEHTLGEYYNGKLCFAILDNPTDAYEWSFVSVPAQDSIRNNKAQNIKLIDFLLAYNFRILKEGKQDSSIVKILLNINNEMSNWIKFGINDFGSESRQIELLQSTLNPEILNQTIDTFYFDESVRELCIRLNK